MSYVDIFHMAMIERTDHVIGKPASEDDIATFERYYDLQLPNDMKEYVLKINGVYCDFRSSMYLEALKNWRSYSEYTRWLRYPMPTPNLLENCFWFGVYEKGSVNWFAALHRNVQTEAPIYALYHGTVTKIADSFTEFMMIFGGPNESLRLGYLFSLFDL